ncbi:Protein EFR3-like B, partial [Ophiophagus hannah]
MSRAQSGLGLLTEQFLCLSGSFNSLSQRQRTGFYLSLAGFMIPSEQQVVAASVCGCCGALRPRYKRLVDNIFPEDPEDGLVKTNMEKLTFYALSAPEKLDRIGAYLSEKLIRDVGRHRYGYVCIAMEALDQLLMACHCQSINLFVESFLKMVAKLLESEKPDLQILGTNSFVKIRMSGIKGLQGVVRKTVNDELQANIWDPQHMDKIVPSLLFNLQHAEEAESRSPSPLQTAEKEKENPAELAERCLRELLGRAAYGNIKNAIKPVLIHLDNHSLWEPNTFAIRCFKIIMYSIQPQHSHLVIQQLLSHLDANSKSAATVRAGIVEVLSEAAIIAASGSVGPTVLEVFNTLLRQLRLSIDYALTGSYDCVIAGGTKIIKEHEERMFQEAIIKTTGSFASTLPTYQRSEVMLFIMSKVPLPSLHHPVDMGKAGENRNRLTQIMLLKSLLQVSTGFQCSNMLTALPSSFLDRLLSATLMEDAEIRLFVLQILISFIDRHGNKHKFQTISTISDISILKLKHSQQLYRHMYFTCKEDNNGRTHYEAVYSLLALISIELANEEVVVDLIRLVLAIQELAQVNEDNLPLYSRCALYALGAAYLNLISQLTTVPAFCQHIHEVIEMRKKEAPYLLPEGVFAVTEPRSPWPRDPLPAEQDQRNEDRLSKRRSIGETISLQVEVESRNSPEKEERAPAEEITYETLKKAIVDSVAVEEQERERRRQVVEKFQKAPFEEIAAHCGARATLLQSKLNQIFEITIRPPPSPSGTITAAYGQPQSHSIPVYEMKFPDLCVY